MYRFMVAVAIMPPTKDQKQPLRKNKRPFVRQATRPADTIPASPDAVSQGTNSSRNRNTTNAMPARRDSPPARAVTAARVLT